MRALRRAIKLKPDDNTNWWQLGELLTSAGEFDAAREAFARAEQIVTERR
jgi:cytochrome c-type biogenesis protein CcmH/NrfG